MVIQEGLAALERVGHRGDIDLRQQVAGEIREHVRQAGRGHFVAIAGTPQRATQASATTLDKTITVRFDSNVAPGLAWTFEPAVRTMDIKIGENTLAFYRAHNRSDRPTTGTASFNVTPEGAGAYFVKVECFCFTEQRLEPGQTVDMPVSFYIDPAIVQDKDLPVEDRFAATLKLAELPRNSSRTRIRNRCELTGRPRAYYRKHKLSRIALRELGNKGLIPGLVKSSW